MNDPGPHTGPPAGARRETAMERFDRHWVELLQELRVMQTGTS